MVILQIVGYKNVGKTTLMTEAVAYLKTLGYCVATIKHHGHGTEDITLQDENVDHMKHFGAGADQSIVQGHAYIQSVQRATNETLADLISRYVRTDCDIVLVEGYKFADYDKVILYRNEAEAEKLRECTHVVCTLDVTAQAYTKRDMSWLVQWLENQKHEGRLK